MANEYIFIYIHNLFATRYSKQAEELAQLHREHKKPAEPQNFSQNDATTNLSSTAPLNYLMEILPLETGYESGGLQTVNYFFEHAVKFIKSKPISDNINLVFDFNLGYSGYNLSAFPYIIAMLKEAVPERITSIKFQLAGSGGGASGTLNRELTEPEQSLINNKLLIGIKKEDLPKLFPELNIKIHMELIVDINNKLKTFNKTQIQSIKIPPRTKATIQTSEAQKRKQNNESGTAPSNLTENEYKFPLWNELNKNIKKNKHAEEADNANDSNENMTNNNGDEDKKPKL